MVPRLYTYGFHPYFYLGQYLGNCVFLLGNGGVKFCHCANNVSNSHSTKLSSITGTTSEYYKKHPREETVSLISRPLAVGSVQSRDYSS